MVGLDGDGCLYNQVARSFPLVNPRYEDEVRATFRGAGQPLRNWELVDRLRSRGVPFRDAKLIPGRIGAGEYPGLIRAAKGVQEVLYVVEEDIGKLPRGYSAKKTWRPASWSEVERAAGLETRLEKTGKKISVRFAYWLMKRFPTVLLRFESAGIDPTTSRTFARTFYRNLMSDLARSGGRSRLGRALARRKWVSYTDAQLDRVIDQVFNEPLRLRDEWPKERR